MRHFLGAYLLEVVVVVLLVSSSSSVSRSSISSSPRYLPPKILIVVSISALALSEACNSFIQRNKCVYLYFNKQDTIRNQRNTKHI